VGVPVQFHPNRDNRFFFHGCYHFISHRYRNFVYGLKEQESSAQLRSTAAACAVFGVAAFMDAVLAWDEAAALAAAATLPHAGNRATCCSSQRRIR
jgi:hypothetical protein